MAAWEFLKTHIWIILMIIAIPFFILVLRAILKRRKRRKNEEELTHLKRRDEALADALRNPLAPPAPRVGEEAVEITWDEKSVMTEKGKSALMAELVELSGYSRRKYVFQADRPIDIGSAPDNRLSLPREGVSKRHCEIFLNGSEACVRSAPGAKTILKRKRKSVQVGQDGVYLKNGDSLRLGAVEIQFRLFKA